MKTVSAAAPKFHKGRGTEIIKSDRLRTWKQLNERHTSGSFNTVDFF
jgi:hypothetical protein